MAIGDTEIFATSASDTQVFTPGNVDTEMWETTSEELAAESGHIPAILISGIY